MAAKVVTFRSSLKSHISDLLTDAHMECAQTEEALVALSIALADHREEGRPLFPRVLICDDLELVLRNIQGTGAIQIGQGPRAPETVMRALKKCAPLADGGWAIWIAREPDSFRFGVFREPTPTALDLRQTLTETDGDGPVCAVLVAQYAPSVVELIIAGREGLRVHLTGERDDQVAAADAESQVVEWVASGLADETRRQSVSTFLLRALHDVLRKGHGTLIAVATADEILWQERGKDSVVLDPPIDLAELVSAHVMAPTALSFADLTACVDLFTGMLNSDGITVLDTRGRLLAFNWFIEVDTSALAARQRLGGARSRAYLALSDLVDNGELYGAFIRSTDGAESAHGKA